MIINVALTKFKGTQGRDNILPLFARGLYLAVSLFYLINKEFLKFGLYLQGGLYSDMVFNTDLNVVFLFLGISLLIYSKIPLTNYYFHNYNALKFSQ